MNVRVSGVELKVSGLFFEGIRRLTVSGAHAAAYLQSSVLEVRPIERTARKGKEFLKKTRKSKENTGKPRVTKEHEGKRFL